MRERRPRLVVIKGEDRGEEVELPEGEVRIGRGRQADVMLKDLSVSRHHLTIVYDGRRVRVRDEGSGNGSFKNGAVLSGEASLEDGDEVEIGDTVFRLSFPRVIVEEPPVPQRGTRGGGGSTVKTRQPERDLKPILLIAGGLLAVAIVGVLAVSVLTGKREEPEPAPIAVTPPPAPTVSQPPPIVIAVPALSPIDAGPVARDRPPRPRDREPVRDRPRDRDRETVREREREPARDPRINKPIGAERVAQEMYEEQDFAGAARTLRESGDPDLGALAKDYATVGAGLARGDANADSNPMIALTAYQEALAGDVRAGESAHAPMIRERLGKVAPAAARAFFDVGRYEHARAACDMAVNFKRGGDPLVAQTRELLEGAAGDLFRRAEAMASSDPSEAELLYKRILKIVPSDSDWARKALAALRG